MWLSLPGTQRVKACLAPASVLVRTGPETLAPATAPAPTTVTTVAADGESPASYSGIQESIYALAELQGGRRHRARARNQKLKGWSYALFPVSLRRFRTKEKIIGASG